mgnify:CR=1 FL=1
MRNIYLLKDAILKVLVDYDNSFELGIDANKKLLSFDEINRKIYK